MLTLQEETLHYRWGSPISGGPKPRPLMREEVQLLAEIWIPAYHQPTTLPKHYPPIRAIVRPTMELMSDVLLGFDSCAEGHVKYLVANIRDVMMALCHIGKVSKSVSIGALADIVAVTCSPMHCDRSLWS